MNREDVLVVFFFINPNDEPFRIFMFFLAGEGGKRWIISKGFLGETQPNSGRLFCFVDGNFRIAFGQRHEFSFIQDFFQGKNAS